MQADYCRSLADLEVTANRVAYRLAKQREIFGMSEDGLAQRARRKPTLEGFFHQENDLAHGAMLSQRRVGRPPLECGEAVAF